MNFYEILTAIKQFKNPELKASVVKMTLTIKFNKEISLVVSYHDAYEVQLVSKSNRVQFSHTFHPSFEPDSPYRLLDSIAKCIGIPSRLIVDYQLRDVVKLYDDSYSVTSYSKVIHKDEISPAANPVHVLSLLKLGFIPNSGFLFNTFYQNLNVLVSVRDLNCFVTANLITPSSRQSVTMCRDIQTQNSLTDLSALIGEAVSHCFSNKISELSHLFKPL